MTVSVNNENDAAFPFSIQIRYIIPNKYFIKPFAQSTFKMMIDKKEEFP